MEKSAVISIRSFSDLYKDEVIEVVTPGKFHLGESEFKAVYEESEISGMDGTTTTLVIKDDVLVLEREGSTSTRMEFKKGEDVLNANYKAIDEASDHLCEIVINKYYDETEKIVEESIYSKIDKRLGDSLKTSDFINNIDGHFDCATSSFDKRAVSEVCKSAAKFAFMPSSSSPPNM